MMRRWVAWALMAAAASALGATIVVLSGLIPINASSGHWRVTAWILDFTKRRSVDMHSLGISVPPLDQPWMILKGAGHYEQGCRPCHGSPAEPRPVMVMRMTPHPPFLPSRMARWDPEELFYIVKHGIKFTGMPGWVAPQREDEIWAMVAFLQGLPQIDAATYRRLAPAETDANRCARCHGADGGGREVAAFPRLAGQSSEYLQRAMRAYASGARRSGIMGPVAAALNEEAIRQLADSHAALPRTTAGPSADAATLARGEALVLRGDPSREVPACSECHGPTTTARNPAYPVLTGQFAEYLVLQLELFAKDRRGGSEYAPIMRSIAGRLTPEQRRDAAAYYASLR